MSSMRPAHAVLVWLAFLALLGALAGGAGAASDDPRLRGIDSFAFALGSGNLDGDVNERFAGYELVVIDGEEASRKQVGGLRERGKLVLGYLSVGTIEPGRSWYRAVRKFRMKQRFEEFGEYYAKLRRAGYRRVMKRVARRFLRKGFDGLFLDNTDMVELFPKQKRGMRKLTRDLSRMAHGRDRLLFTQNGDETIGPLLRFYDGWNREDVTWTYDFESERYERVSAADHRQAIETLERIAGRGLLTTATDYTAGGSAADSESVRNACAAGALPFVSNIELTRIRRRPFLC